MANELASFILGALSGLEHMALAGARRTDVPMTS